MPRGRFTSIKLKQDKLGRRHYEGSLYPTIPLDARDKYIYTKFGDRLDTLASKYFGHQQHWWILAQSNNIVGTMHVKPGTHLRIPSNWAKLIQDYEELNLKG